MSLKRLRNLIIEMIIMIFVAITITFWLMHLIPGRSGDLSSLMVSPEIKAAIRDKYHLASPVTTQYFVYIWHLLSFDFGVSMSIHPDMPITQFIMPKVFLSLEIALISVTLASVIGIILGVLISMKPNSSLDNFWLLIISIGISLPAFIIAILLATLGSHIGLPIMFQKANLATWILPILSYIIPTMFTKMKYIRDSIFEAQSSQYTKFARVKGASNLRILFFHLLKPSLTSTLVQLPLVFTGSIIGGVFVESIFGIPGMGSMLGGSITAKDYDVTMFIILLTSVLTIVGFFLSEVAQRVVNPRLRFK